MCGIGGIVGSPRNFGLVAACKRMMSKLMHRGPDDSGLFFSESKSIGLVHTRLSILDLSSAGHQPMSTPDSRFTIVFNGEIYNFKDLRNELETLGIAFSSGSDTEVILRMYERFGHDCVRRFEGMFAIAIWDSREEELFLARGPMGIKPLYIWQVDDTIAFASEIRAVLEAQIAPINFNADALKAYLEWGSPQEPASLVSGVSLLPPGHYLSWKAGKTIVSSYWQIDFPCLEIDEQSAVSVCRDALSDSVRSHFVSDVPVGIFLSGGLDSTAILALAKANGLSDIHTFCISFDDQSSSEGDVAQKTAEHFGTTHHDWRMKPNDASKLLPEYLQSIDQPSIDGFNVFCVSKLARREGLKVVLSGLGGDELFGSYPSFAWIPRLMTWHDRFRGLRGIQLAFGAVMGSLPYSTRLRRLGQFFTSSGTALNAYQSTRAIFSSAEAVRLAETFCPGTIGSEHFQETLQLEPSFRTIGDHISFLEMTRYMLNQLLRDSDVMSMANGLELRVPFVDSRLISVVGAIPANYRLKRGKKLLIDAVPEIPEWVRNRRKQGFSFPLREWIGEFWKDEINRIKTTSPVPISTWYQAWALLSLERFLESSIPKDVQEPESLSMSIGR